MDTDDTGKPRRSLVAPADPMIGGYAELYPSIARRLVEAENSVKPEVRRRMVAVHEALKKKDAHRRQTLATIWRLTATEARLAMHLADGGTVAGYAEIFGVTEGTVRSQLKAIFAKTGVNRQAALTALIAGR
jgi:DNA-binding CsgD family transcriptional regulator